MKEQIDRWIDRYRDRQMERWLDRLIKVYVSDEVEMIVYTVDRDNVISDKLVLLGYIDRIDGQDGWIDGQDRWIDRQDRWIETQRRK